MNDFPNNYKLIGNGLFASEKSVSINRSDDDVLIVFGNVGGMAAFVGLFFAFLVERFGELNLRTLLVGHLYKQDHATEYTVNKEGSKNLKGEVEISPPKCLELRYFVRDVLCCCCKCVFSASWAKYHRKVDAGYEHLLENLDVINFLRRIKQQRFTNRILGMDNVLRKYVDMRSKKTSIGAVVY
jgi:hypothetical protein